MGRWVTERIVRTSQPQEPVEIDLANPITRGIVFAVSHTDSRNAITNTAPAFDTAAIRAVSNIGKTLHTTAQPSAATWPGVISTSDNNGTGDFTLLSYSRPVSESNISALISQCAGFTLAQAYILANTNAAYGVSAGNITFGTQSGLITASNCVDNRPHVYLGIRSGTTHIIDVDGKQKTTGTILAGDIYTADSSEIYASGIKGYTGWTRAHPHVLQIAWNRALTSSERASIGVNPWQIYKPIERKIWIPSAVAGGGFKPHWASHRTKQIGVR